MGEAALGFKWRGLPSREGTCKGVGWEIGGGCGSSRGQRAAFGNAPTRPGGGLNAREYPRERKEEKFGSGSPAVSTWRRNAAPCLNRNVEHSTSLSCHLGTSCSAGLRPPLHCGAMLQIGRCATATLMCCPVRLPRYSCTRILGQSVLQPQVGSAGAAERGGWGRLQKGSQSPSVGCF